MNVGSINNQNSVLTQNTQNKANEEVAKEQTQKLFGYEVDKSGFLSSEFNKDAGLDESIKIKAEDAISFVKGKTTQDDRFASYDSIDVAKTLSNAATALKAEHGEDVKLSAQDLFKEAQKTPSHIEGDVSYMGRLKGLDKNMSADEFRMQIGIVNSFYRNDVGGMQSKPLDKMPDHIKDIINFTNDIKAMKNENLANPFEKVYESLEEDKKLSFQDLQEKAKDAIIELNHARSDMFASMLFGERNSEQTQKAAQSLEDFTSFYMNAQIFFNKSHEEQLSATQLELKNAFTNLHKKQFDPNIAALNLLA